MGSVAYKLAQACGSLSRSHTEGPVGCIAGAALVVECWRLYRHSGYRKSPRSVSVGPGSEGAFLKNNLFALLEPHLRVAEQAR
jgi:hypothetical protein